MEQKFIYKSLKDALRAFDPIHLEESLDDQFKKLAIYFLYGGYIHVKSSNVDRRVYIREVEFYFFDETNKLTNVNEKSAEKVYHRNNSKYYVNVPDNPILPIGNNTHYFKMGSLYMHSSGVDITFEDGESKYRASALIRAFAIEEKVGERYELQSVHKKFNMKDNRSTYIYEYLFEGLSIFEDTNYSIKWEDTELNWKKIPVLEGIERINYPGDKWRFVWKETR